MAHFDSGFFFLVGNISIIAWGRSFLLRYDRSISGSTAVRSNQPHRIESRDQTDPHTGQSTVHIKDQRKSSTCMERQQRHSVEFRLITLCVIFFHKKLCDSSGELAEIVGGKDRRAVISAGSLESTPLERHCEEYRIKSYDRAHSGWQETKQQNCTDINSDTDKTKICGKMFRYPDRKDHSCHIDQKCAHTQHHVRKVSADDITHNTEKVGSLCVAEKIGS